MKSVMPFLIASFSMSAFASEIVIFQSDFTTPVAHSPQQQAANIDAQKKAIDDAVASLRASYKSVDLLDIRVSFKSSKDNNVTDTVTVKAYVE